MTINQIVCLSVSFKLNKFNNKITEKLIPWSGLKCIQCFKLHKVHKINTKKSVDGIQDFKDLVENILNTFFFD